MALSPPAPRSAIAIVMHIHNKPLLGHLLIRWVAGDNQTNGVEKCWDCWLCNWTCWHHYSESGKVWYFRMPSWLLIVWWAWKEQWVGQAMSSPKYSHQLPHLFASTEEVDSQHHQWWICSNTQYHCWAGLWMSGRRCMPMAASKRRGGVDAIQPEAGEITHSHPQSPTRKDDDTPIDLIATKYIHQYAWQLSIFSTSCVACWGVDRQVEGRL